MRPQGLKAGAETRGIGDNLTGHRGGAGAQSVDDAKLERIEAKLIGQFIHELFLNDGGLRHTKSAKSPGGNAVGVNRTGGCAEVRHRIGAGGVNRHAIGDGRSPGRIGAGVEVGGKIDGY